jgi:hypothetical protein
MAARLSINERRYTLAVQREGEWAGIAVLDGGANALIADTALLTDVVIERAIDLAEEWLMPHAKTLKGETLCIDDIAGHFRAGLLEILAVKASTFSVPDIEDHFLEIVALATGRSGSLAVRHKNHFVADLILVRELSHHGALTNLQLSDR